MISQINPIKNCKNLNNFTREDSNKYKKKNGGEKF